MKTTITALTFLFPLLLSAQTVDSTAIRQVDSLIRVSRDLTAKREYGKALEVSEMAEKIALEKIGQASAAYGSCCFNHGRVLHLKKDYPEAEKWYLESKSIREKALGKEHPDHAWSLNNLANLYKDLGQYEKSEPLHLEAKSIREKTLGKEHPDYAASLHNLANLYWNLGQYEKAEPLFLEAKSIREKALGKEHPDYAWSLNNLAVLYMDLGQYEKVEPLYLESKTIQEKTLGKEHPDYAANLHNLAILYKYLGQYEKAESLCLEALTIRSRVLGMGKEHPDYAQSLNSLAILYRDMGQYEKGEQLYLESKSILEKTPGKEHPDYAASLHNLASLYWHMGQYEKAEPLYLENKAIFEKTLGKEHPKYAASLNNLASLYKDLGQYEKAGPLFLEAKPILEKALGKEHPDYAQNLNSLAVLYMGLDQYEKVEPLHLEAITIREKALGKEHPDYAASLNGLAFLYWQMGQYEKAEPLFQELSTANKRLIESAMLHLSEKELNNYLNLYSQRQDQLLSFTQITNSKITIPLCYDNSLFYKGFLLQAAGRIKLLALKDEGATEKFNRLKGYQRRLAKQYARPIAERDSALMAQLETKANDIEKDLARSVNGWGEARRQVQWQEVQATLQEAEAAVEFVRYRYYGKKATDSTMYAALVLLPGSESPGPCFIPLFEEKQLDSLLLTQGEHKADYVNALYTVAARGARPVGTPQKSLYELKKQLYELIWQPLEQALGNAKTIYYSPSGLLHRLSLGAIPISDEVTIGEQYRLVAMNSTRSRVLGIIPIKVQVTANDAVLYGGIHYEIDSMAIAAANQGAKAETLAGRGALSFSYTDSTDRGGSWNYLAGTDKEVDSVNTTLSAAGFKTEVRKGYAATEESFKAIGNSHGVTSSHPVTGSPRILHIATHGFFFPDPETNPQSVPRARDNPQLEEPVFKLSDHPMIRSGLILAGGNHAWSRGLGSRPLQPNMEDGILTAYEISQMNLSSTELVVLSACETGLGDIQGNEGVYGLQRAFKIAGAKYLMMSLWQVPDQETSVFMTTFYKHWLEGKMAIPDAFRATQREMRERFLNPYQWAGFVLVE